MHFSSISFTLASNCGDYSKPIIPNRFWLTQQIAWKTCGNRCQCIFVFGATIKVNTFCDADVVGKHAAYDDRITSFINDRSECCWIRWSCTRWHRQHHTAFNVFLVQFPLCRYDDMQIRECTYQKKTSSGCFSITWFSCQANWFRLCCV